MAEFWEENFREKQMMWGEAPVLAAGMACGLFQAQGARRVLIPGIGYGRNARPFLDAGMAVTGIEISETAIGLARAALGLDIVIHHGSVGGMPFDAEAYDGVFCHAVIHLLEAPEREKLIRDCYAQLAEGGWMVFTAISTTAPTYGTGVPLGHNQFAQHGGVRLYFYDEAAVREAFSAFGLVEVHAVTETNGMPFWVVVCRKG